SLAEEVAVAGGEELAAAGPLALAHKAGGKGAAAAARRAKRGRVSSNFDSEQRDRGGPVAGSCRNGVCSQDDGENCFVAGTPVATPTGPTPIERLEPGDLVLSRDQVTGNFSTQRVSATFITLDRDLTDVHTVAMSGEEATLRVTPGHLFWTRSDTWVPADQLVYGDALTDNVGVEVGVVSVEPIRDRATVYNLEVEGTHTYFAGATPVWVHNGNCFSGRKKDDQSQNPSEQNQPDQNQPGQSSQPSNNSHSKQQVVDYINGTIAAENDRLRKAYNDKVGAANAKGKTVDEWNAAIDKKIDKVANGDGEYADDSEEDRRKEIERLNDRRIPPNPPQISSIASLDGAAAASTTSCREVKCTDFGGTLFTQAGGTSESTSHEGPIQPNQLVNVSLRFPQNSDSNNHVYSVYYDNAGNAYVIQSYVGHEVPIVSKMTQAEYQQLYAQATSGGPGWKDAYQRLFRVTPRDSNAPETSLTDPS
ncbi:MAG TPA: polymorphic toxin-type HINT domain-containing protein, partial [Polyangiaceae bacterium]